MKYTCTNCGINKSIEEFAWRNEAKNRRLRKCRTCCNLYTKAWYARDPKKHKERVLKTQKGLKQRNKDYVRAAKNKPCTDCKVSYPYYVMEFDHLPQFEKTGNISHMSMTSSHLVLQKEIDKCEVVCSNCHAIRIHDRRTKQK